MKLVSLLRSHRFLPSLLHFLSQATGLMAVIMPPRRRSCVRGTGTHVSLEYPHSCEEGYLVGVSRKGKGKDPCSYPPFALSYGITPQGGTQSLLLQLSLPHAFPSRQGQRREGTTPGLSLRRSLLKLPYAKRHVKTPQHS